MSEFYKSIKQGLGEAIAFSKEKCPQAVVHEFSPVDVKNIRSNMGMSQTEFASAFGISVSTLRHWERGDRVPHGPAGQSQSLSNVLAGITPVVRNTQLLNTLSYSRRKS